MPGKSMWDDPIKVDNGDWWIIKNVARVNCGNCRGRVDILTS